MILVDVHVPSLDAVYDFSVSEEAEIGLLIDEISEIICQREKLTGVVAPDELMLCAVEGGMILPREATLQQCGIGTGTRLMLF